MRIRRVLPGLLAAVLVVVLATAWWLLHTESGARFAWQRAVAATDGALSAESLTGAISSGLQVRGLRFAADGFRVAVDTAAFAADLDVLPPGIEISAARLDGLQVTTLAGAKSAQAVDIGATLRELLPRLRLPLSIKLDNLIAKDSRIAVAGTRPYVIDRLTLSADWDDAVQLSLAIDTADVDAGIDGVLELAPGHALQVDARLRTTAVPDLHSASLSAELDGAIDNYTLAVASRLEHRDLPGVDVQIDGRGSLDEFNAGTIAIRADDVDVRGSGNARWAGGLAAGADLSVVRLDPSPFADAWPAALPISGRLQFDYVPGRLDIGTALLQVADTTTRISASGVVDLPGSSVDGQLEWQNLRWPPVDPETRFSSPDGRLQLTGSLDDWRAGGNVAIAAAGFEPARVTLTGEGSRSGVAVDIAEARLFGGSIAGKAAADWRGQQPWSAALEVSGIRTEAFVAELAGTLSGRVDATGTLQPFGLTATLGDVRGMLAELPVSAAGTLSVDVNRVAATGLEIRHGPTELTLDGALSDPAGMRYFARIERLDAYHPDAAGRLEATGAVGVRDNAPWLRLTAGSELLSIAGVQVNDLAIADAAETEQTLAHLRASARKVTVRGQEITGPSVELLATREQQTLKLDVGYEGIRLLASASGDFDPAAGPALWRGSLNDLLFVFAGHPPVSLVEPAELAVSAQSAAVDGLCLREPGGAQLCGRYDWQQDENVDIALALSSMPLQMLNASTDTGFDFDQEVSGHFDWHQRANSPPAGSAGLVVTAGFITSEDQPALKFETATSRLDFDVANGRLLAADLEIPMPGTGVIDGSFRVNDVANPMSSDVSGNLNVFMHDIGALAAVSPLIDAAAGRVSGQVAVSGSVSEPLLTGSIDVADGRIDYLPIGLSLQDINLTGQLRGASGFDIEGSFVSGDGSGRISSSAGIRGSNHHGVQVSIAGDGLQLINVDDIQARGDVDLDVAYAPGRLGLDGRVFVRHARITPATLPTSRSTVSEDVVIVAGQLPDETSPAQPSELTMFGELEVAIGEDVSIDIGPAKATISGSTTFAWNGDPMPIADGRYDLTGSVQAFGQPLTISEGGVRFASVPADNPYLRIRAVREIYGNAQVKEAGVLVDGPLLAPTIEAYTRPLTTEERALALLVTGSDFDLEQGIGAVDFGTYIAPRLYLSYGVGIFDRDNVISARYDLKKGFGVRVTSGQRESGADFTYRIER